MPSEIPACEMDKDQLIKIIYDLRGKLNALRKEYEGQMLSAGKLRRLLTRGRRYEEEYFAIRILFVKTHRDLYEHREHKVKDCYYDISSDIAKALGEEWSPDSDFYMGDQLYKGTDPQKRLSDIAVSHPAASAPAPECP